MSIINPGLFGFLGQEEVVSGYFISRSLRFESSDSAYLSRTPASAGNRTTFTWAAWVKLTTFGSAQTLFAGRDGSAGNQFEIRLESDNTFFLNTGGNPGSRTVASTAAVFRDPSAWYHLTCAVDTTQASASNHFKFYVNNVLQTLSLTASGPQNLVTQVNGAFLHHIGVARSLVRYFNGYLADIHFIDGQALDPTSFGEFDATTGVWVPKAYTGTYGTNGFKLDFADNSSNTATTLGKDSSGAGNHWTPVNLSINSGGPTSVAASSGALPIYNTTDTYGGTKGTGTRTDANASSLVLALPMDGANNGTTFTDESATIKGSGSAKTATATNVITSTAQSKFYGSSGYFDGGTSTRLTYASSADFALGTGAYTIEAWIYATSYASVQGSIFDSGNANGGALNFFLVSNGALGIGIYGVGNLFTTSSSAVALNRWAHVTVVRSSTGTNDTRIYVDGLLAVTGTDSTNWSVTTTPSVGGIGIAGYSFAGYIQDLRVYKGVAKYTGSFNPPSSTQNATVAAGNDSLVDVPQVVPTNGAQTDTGVGGEVRGNYATLNPLTLSGYASGLENGNLYFIGPADGFDTIASATIAISTGKWYWEVTAENSSGTLSLGQARGLIGIKPTSFAASSYPSHSYASNGQKFDGSTFSNYGAAINTGDVIGVALNLDAGTITFYENGVSQGTAFSSLASNTYAPCVVGAGNGLGAAFRLTLNFGQRPFAYTAPSGFKALCTANLPAPLVTKSSTVFDTVLYTGNGSARSITGLGFSPDLVWIKSRSAATAHELTDSVRGVTKSLSSNTTGAEATDTNGLTAFNSDGFSLGTDTNYNNNTATYAGWCWDAGSTTVTNTQGSITTSLRTNNYLSVITYTGTGSNATIGHGLGVAPEFFLIKRRNTTSSWIAWHTSIGNSDILRLESTNAKQTISGFWQNTRPTSSLIYLDTDGTVNANGGTYVCYAFAPSVGYSSFGSYTGNGSADGPFVYTGFRPRWILMKIATGGTASWVIWDTARSPSNVTDKYLWADSSNAEGTFAGLDILSNGFKWRSSDSSLNQSNSTYIYAAFAEAPFAANNRAR